MFEALRILRGFGKSELRLLRRTARQRAYPRHKAFQLNAQRHGKQANGESLCSPRCLTPTLSFFDEFFSSTACSGESERFFLAYNLPRNVNQFSAKNSTQKLTKKFVEKTPASWL